jgi:uncharacterized protein YjdB
VQITARAAYTDGSVANVQGTATWTSSNPAVATVAGGLVTGVSPGQVTIAATVVDHVAGTVSSTASITVTSYYDE